MLRRFANDILNLYDDDDDDERTEFEQWPASITAFGGAVKLRTVACCGSSSSSSSL